MAKSQLMLFCSFLLLFLTWNHLSAAKTKASSFSSRPQAKQSVADIQSQLSPQQWEAAQELIAKKRKSLINDPFTPETFVEAKLAEWTQTQLALGVFTDNVNSSGSADDGEFWQKRLETYEEQLAKMEKAAEEAEESQKLLEEVYVYEQELVLVGAAKMDDAYVLIKFRNGQDDKVTHVAVSIDLSYPGDIGQIFDRRWKTVRPKTPINAWETRDVKVPIKDFFPEDLHFRTKSDRDLVTARVKLENFRLGSTKKNAIKRMPGSMMNSMMSAKMGMEEARYALNSLEEKEE